MRAVALAIKWRAAGQYGPMLHAPPARTQRRSSDYTCWFRSGRRARLNLWTWHPSDVKPPEHAGAFVRQCTDFLRSITNPRVSMGSRAALRAQQMNLLHRLPRRSLDKDPPAFIGGADVGFEQGGEGDAAAMVLLKYPSCLNR